MIARENQRQEYSGRPEADTTAETRQGVTTELQFLVQAYKQHARQPQPQVLPQIRASLGEACITHVTACPANEQQQRDHGEAPKASGAKEPEGVRLQTEAKPRQAVLFQPHE